MLLLGDAGVVAVREVRLDVEARARVARHLDEHLVSQLEPRTRRHALPVDSLHGEVLAHAAGKDRVPFRLERSDLLQGKEAERALRAAVVFRIPVCVAGEPELGDLRGSDGQLGHAAFGYVDLRGDRAIHQRDTSVPVLCAMARSYASRAVTASSGAHPTDLKSVISRSPVRPGFFRETTSPSSAFTWRRRIARALIGISRSPASSHAPSYV